MSGRALIVHTLISIVVQAGAGGVHARDVQVAAAGRVRAGDMQVAGCADLGALMVQCGASETWPVTVARRCVALCRGRQQPVAALSSRLCLCCGDLRAIETILMKECDAKCPNYKPDTIHQPPCNQENTFVVFNLRNDRKGRVKREWPPRRVTQRQQRNQRESANRKKEPTERPPKRHNREHKKRPTERPPKNHRREQKKRPTQKPPKHKQRRPQKNPFKKQNSKHQNRRNERERGARGRSTVRPGGKLEEGEGEEPGATRPSPQGELPAGVQRLNQSASSANISSEFLNMTTSNVTTLLNSTAFLKILHKEAVKDRVMFELKKNKKKKPKGKTPPKKDKKKKDKEKKDEKKKEEEPKGEGGPRIGTILPIVFAVIAILVIVSYATFHYFRRLKNDIHTTKAMKAEKERMLPE